MTAIFKDFDYRQPTYYLLQKLWWTATTQRGGVLRSNRWLTTEGHIRGSHLLQIHRSWGRSRDSNRTRDTADARQAAAGSKSSLVPVQLPVALSVLVSAVTGSIRPCAAKFQHVPVEDIVIGEALLVEQVAEKLPEVTGKKEHEKLEQRTLRSVTLGNIGEKQVSTQFYLEQIILWIM